MGVTAVVIAASLGIGVGLAGLLRVVVGAPAARRRTRTGGRAALHGYRTTTAPDLIAKLEAPSQSTVGSGDDDDDDDAMVGLAGRAHRLVLPAALAALAGLLTRWPVAALLVGAAALGVPALVRQTRTTRATARLEAVASWTELLRDTLAAAAGLSQAIVTTAPVSPTAIRPPVQRLAARLTGGVAMTTALLEFAEDVADPSTDVVVCALLLAASARAQRLGELLGSLAESIREDVAMRLRVESSRASARSGVRTVVVFSLVFAAALAVLARSYLAPFGTTGGQLVLLLVGGCYAAGLALMVRLVRPPAPVRLLGGGAVLPHEGGASPVTPIVIVGAAGDRAARRDRDARRDRALDLDPAPR